MVRLAILLILLLMTVWEWRRGSNKHLYWAGMAGLFLFFSLRYGQGTDYLNYLSIYATIKPLQMLPNYFEYSFNKVEIGFFYLISFFRMLHMPFTWFIVLVTGSSLLLIDRFIRRFSPLPVFSLFFFFAVYSLTYMESGIRQLMSISLVLGWVLVDWTQGHRWRALIGIALASLLHTSALALLVLPLLFYKERDQWPFSWSLRRLVLLFGGLIAVMLAVNYVNLEPVLRLLPGSVGPTLVYYYLTTKSFSPMALANRLLFVVLSLALAWRVRDQMSQKERFLFKLYIVGFCIYLLLMSVDLVASRMNVYFRIVEIALLPALLYRNRDFAKRLVPVVAALLVLVCGIYVKDMRAIMGFSLYYESNPLKYPYVTVMSPETLLDVRYIPIKYEPYMNQAAYGQFDFDNYYRKVQRKPSLSSPVVPY